MFCHCLSSSKKSKYKKTKNDTKSNKKIVLFHCCLCGTLNVKLPRFKYSNLNLMIDLHSAVLFSSTDFQYTTPKLWKMAHFVRNRKTNLNSNT